MTSRNGQIVLVPSGRLDRRAAIVLDELARSAHEVCETVVVDFREVGSTSASGLEMLPTIARHARLTGFRQHRPARSDPGRGSSLS